MPEQVSLDLGASVNFIYVEVAYNCRVRCSFLHRGFIAIANWLLHSLGRYRVVGCIKRDQTKELIAIIKYSEPRGRRTRIISGYINHIAAAKCILDSPLKIRAIEPIRVSDYSPTRRNEDH